MNNHKRSSTILLALVFCIAFSNTLFAQPMGVVKPEQLIRVDAQPFMISGKLNHGYYVFRSKVQNLDSKPHKVSLVCPNVASKSFKLQPRETINASLPLPVMNSNFGSDIQVYSDNQKLYSVPCPMHHNYISYSSPRRPYVSYAPDENSISNTFLISRSLRKQFIESECIFSETDCKYWPQDRLDYSCLDFIILTPAELAVAPAGVQNALHQFVLSGGILWLFNCEEQTDSLKKIEWITQIRNEANALDYTITETGPKNLPSVDIHFPDLKSTQIPVAFGGIVLIGNSAEDFDNMTFDVLFKIIWKSQMALSKPLWYEQEPLRQWQQDFKTVDSFSIPVSEIGVVLFLFVFLAGPFNLFILTKYNKRILLFVTVPALSFLFSIAILLYTVLSDGFRTEVRLNSFNYLDQRTGAYSSMTQMGVYARTTPRNVQFDSNDELNISVNDISPKNLSLVIDWTTGKQALSRIFAPVRTPAYYKTRKTGTTRLKLEFDFKAEHPYVLNGLGKDITTLVVRDEKGGLWKAEFIAAGQKTLLVNLNKNEGNVAGALAYPYLISHRNWVARNNLLVTNAIDRSFSFDNDLPNNCYVLFFNSPGPFSSKGIEYAQEKSCASILLGRFK